MYNSSILILLKTKFLIRRFLFYAYKVYFYDVRGAQDSTKLESLILRQQPISYPKEYYVCVFLYRYCVFIF